MGNEDTKKDLKREYWRLHGGKKAIQGVEEEESRGSPIPEEYVWK